MSVGDRNIGLMFFYFNMKISVFICQSISALNIKYVAWERCKNL